MTNEDDGILTQEKLLNSLYKKKIITKKQHLKLLNEVVGWAKL